jgi:serine/threonine-protein kinase
VVSDPLPSIRLVRPDVPPELEAVIAKCLEKNPDNRYQTVSELADALAPFAPRSVASVTRISGILRASSLRPPAADKSPSSDRTLQSPKPVTGDQPTEVDRVKIVAPAPAARSEKSTRPDWEASPSEAGRSRRRLVVGVIAAVAVTVAVVVWQRRPMVTMEARPDPSAAKAGVSASGTETTPSSAPAAPVTVSAAPVASAPALPEAAPSASASAAASAKAPSVPEATAAKTPKKTKPPAAVAPPAAAPPAAAPPAAAPAAPKPVSDPLDGRR